MRPRVAFALLLFRLGRFIKSLAVMVMRPNDLLEFMQRSYSRPDAIEFWSSQRVVESGLYNDEKNVLKEIPIKKGRLLLLGLGGGREAIPLAQMGFNITGVDFVPELVNKTVEYAAQKGITIEGITQDISELDISKNTFDVAWLSANMYSCIPTTRKRIQMVKAIRASLKPGGYFVCQYLWRQKDMFSPKVEMARKIVSFITLGNFGYEKGDMISNKYDFLHQFHSIEEIRTEFEKGGLEVIRFHFPENDMLKWAVLRNPGE